jgi:hypothetical protein
MSDRDGAPDDAPQHKTWVKVSFKTFGNRDRGSTPSPHQAGQGTCTPKLLRMLGAQNKSPARPGFSVSPLLDGGEMRSTTSFYLRPTD